MRNTHWPEPITVDVNDVCEDIMLGSFFVNQIVDRQNQQEITEENLLAEDSEDYSILHRTAYRLERCYNACAGLNIQSDTKLRELLAQILDECTSYQEGELSLDSIDRIQALLSEQIVQGE